MDFLIELSPKWRDKKELKFKKNTVANNGYNGNSSHSVASYMQVKKENHTMLPNKTGKIKSNRSFERLVNIFHGEFKNGKPLKLENDIELEDGKFILKKQSVYFSPFDRKIIMSELRGQILENEIQYEIRMTNLMKAVFWIDTIALIAIAISQIISKEFMTGIMLFISLIIILLITYFWLKSEFRYLENRFQEKMKYV